MRRELIRHLQREIPSVAGEVYQIQMAGPKRKPPYLAVKFGAEISDPGARYAYDQVVEIWPYVDNTNFYVLDDIVREVIKAMSKEIAGYSFKYLGTGADYHDPDFNQLTRGPIEFEINLIRE